MLVGEQQRALTQKNYPRMALLCPSICLQTRKMTVVNKAQDQQQADLVIDLDQADKAASSFRVCGDDVMGHVLGSEVSEWFSQALGVNCHLVQQSAVTVRSCRSAPSVKLSYANESQFLLASEASMRMLQKAATEPVDVSCFRANIVIDGPQLGAYDEDSWLGKQLVFKLDDTISMKLQQDDVTINLQRACQRCRMVCVAQATGVPQSEPLKALSATRRESGKTYFGVHCGYKEDFSGDLESTVLTVGMSLTVKLE